MWTPLYSGLWTLFLSPRMLANLSKVDKHLLKSLIFAIFPDILT